MNHSDLRSAVNRSPEPLQAEDISHSGTGHLDVQIPRRGSESCRAFRGGHRILLEWLVTLSTRHQIAKAPTRRGDGQNHRITSTEQKTVSENLFSLTYLK